MIIDSLPSTPWLVWLVMTNVITTNPGLALHAKWPIWPDGCFLFRYLAFLLAKEGRAAVVYAAKEGQGSSGVL